MLIGLSFLAIQQTIHATNNSDKPTSNNRQFWHKLKKCASRTAQYDVVKNHKSQLITAVLMLF